MACSRSFLGIQANEQQQSYPGFEQMMGSSSDPNVGLYNSYPHESSNVAPNLEMPMHFPHKQLHQRS